MCLSKESTDIGTEKWKNSGSTTGDRIQGLWLCAPVLWPLSYHAEAAAALNHLLLDAYQCQRFTVGWLPCCSLQPTAADVMSCYVVCGLTTNWSYKKANPDGELIHQLNHSFCAHRNKALTLGRRGGKLLLWLICCKSLQHIATHGVGCCSL